MKSVNPYAEILVNDPNGSDYDPQIPDDMYDRLVAAVEVFNAIQEEVTQYIEDHWKERFAPK